MTFFIYHFTEHMHMPGISDSLKASVLIKSNWKLLSAQYVLSILLPKILLNIKTLRRYLGVYFANALSTQKHSSRGKQEEKKPSLLLMKSSKTSFLTFSAHPPLF